MVPGFATSAMLLGLLLLFFVVNLHNVVTGIRARRGKATRAEIPSPSGPWMTLASIGTLVFFLEAVLYGFLGPLGYGDPIPVALVPIPGLFSVMSGLGLALLAGGVLLFLWSVSARGRYSVSWEMPEDQMLVTWGPYRYVRHPSYLGYFLMFLGLAVMVNNPVVLVPLLAVAGYVRLADAEESLLVARFGDEYRRYMGSVGRFTPRIRRSR